jgi:SNF family Na+-dependent transporter
MVSTGLGFSAVLVSFFVSFYYNVIIGWAFHFLISSFNYQLPWKVLYAQYIVHIVH